MIWSSAGARRQVRRIAIPLHLDVGEGPLDLAHIVSSQFEGGSAEILLQAVHLGGARDRHDPGLLRQQPPQRDLGRGRPLGRRDRPEQIDERLVRLAGFW